MMRTRLLGVVLSVLLVGFGPAHGQPARATHAGQFFPAIVEPIRQEDTQTLRSTVLSYLERTTAEGQTPTLIFEFRPGESEPGQSSFGAAIDLADFLARDLGAAKTVAYVPESLTGFAVLPVLACNEIVIGPDASLGPIAPEDRRIPNSYRESIRELARSRGRDPDLLLGLLEPGRDLRQVHTADGAAHFVLAENLDEFRKMHQVLDEIPAWEGRRGVLTPDRARQTIARLQAEDRAKIAEVYELPSTAADPTLAAAVNPYAIPIHGRVSPLAQSFLLRQIERARTDGANLIIFEINSEGGLYEEANKIADAIAQLKGVKTIALLDDRAMGVSALIPLACDEIVFRKGSRMGQVRQQIVDSGGETEELDERLTKLLADRAEGLARLKGHPAAVARAMVDPDAVVVRARDKQTGTVALVLDDRLQAEPGRYELLETVKSADNAALTLNDETARQLQMSDRVVRDFDELQSALGLRGKVVRQVARTWVDSLVDTLNEPWLRSILLIIGFFMLAMEVKLPGIGLPAILSTLAFLVYFWSGYLGGTADMLEILLFVVGVLSVAVELFVFPGLGVFGLSGVVLILASVIMAGQTFVWPTQDYEYRQLTWSIFRVLGVIGGVIVAVLVLGRFFPSVPFFNRMILKPDPPDGMELEPSQKPPPDPDAPFTFLLGEVGTTTTVLRPSGKARFGEMLVDVTADGFWISAGQQVEVVEIQGQRIVVKRV